MSQKGQAPEGTVVITHHQTAGRGQRGNTWQSGKGLNLTFSAVLNPVFLTATQQFILNKAVALAIHDVVNKYAPGSVRVKWPNDIMIGDKKVCGILIENQITGDRIGRSIVGIGLNVNQAVFDSPLATSISVDSGKAIDLAEVFENLLQGLEWRYLEVRSRESGVRSRESGVSSQESVVRRHDLDKDYLQSLYRINEKHRFIVDDKEVEGIIRNVDPTGRLLVGIEKRIQSFDFKEIKYVY
jgi:BirA family biotin operon repressor/biotin-[acetyl-CoA-carboxylase] ligase